MSPLKKALREKQEAKETKARKALERQIAQREKLRDPRITTTLGAALKRAANGK